MTLDEQKNLENDYVMNTFARKPVCLVRGNGVRVFDDADAEYLDFIAGIGVCSLGHCHPAVTSAIQKQAETLIHVSNYYYIEKRGQVASMISEALCAGGASDNWKTFFANSGAEANECAMKLARLWSKRASHGGGVIITLDGSFHGRTMETLAATAQPAKQEAFQPLPQGFVHVPVNDVDALTAAFNQNSNQVCAVMLECIQGESGVHPCTPEFLQAAEKLAHENGALLIADEVQTGVYRTGTPFAFQQLGITPDVVAIAKGIASGFPMGACAARASVADAFEPGDHGSTFGGSNLAIAAAYATLTTLRDENIADHVRQMGGVLQDALRDIDGVREVRGMGLMVACDLDEAKSAPDIVVAGLKSGLLLNATGPHTLRFLPPLIIEAQDILEMARRLADLIAQA